MSPIREKGGRKRGRSRRDKEGGGGEEQGAGHQRVEGIGEAGKEYSKPMVAGEAATVWSAMVSSAAWSGNSAASQASSASAAPVRAPDLWRCRARRNRPPSAEISARSSAPARSQVAARRVAIAARARPGQHQPVAIALGAEPIEPAPRRRLVHAAKPPPAMAHRIQRLGLGIGQPQPRRNRLASSVTATASAPSRRTDPAAVPAHARPRSSRQTARYRRRRRKSAAAGRHPPSRHSARRAVRDHQLQHFHAHAFGRQARKPRAPADAGEISGAIGLARADRRRECGRTGGCADNPRRSAGRGRR